MILPGALVVAGALVPFIPVLAGEALFFGDFQAAFVPLRVIVGAAWRTGLPLWTDALRNGQPVLASPFASALYPPNLVFALPLATPAHVLSLLVAAHALWGALGALLLLRDLGRSRPAAAAGAIVFSWGGAAISSSYLVLLHSTWSWIPWLVLGVRGAVTHRGSLRLLAAAGVTLIAILAGDPSMVVSALGGAALVAFPTGERREDPSSARRHGALRGAAGIALGLLAALPLLAAQARFVASTDRGAGFAAGQVLERSLGPLESLGFALPSPFGDPFTVGPGGFLAGALFDGGFPLLPGLYVGLLALALAATGALRGGRGRTGPLLWLGVAILLALGSTTFVGRAAAAAPLVRSLRFPVKWVLGATLPFALLAARGVDSVFPRPGEEPQGRRRLFLALGGSLLTGAAILGAAAVPAGRLLAPRLAARSELGRREIAEEAARTLRVSLLGAALPLAGGLLAAGAGAKRLRGSGSVVVAALVGADLLGANWGLAPSVAASIVEQVPASARLLLNDGAAAGRIWVDGSVEALRIASRIPAGRLDRPVAVALQRSRLEGWLAAGLGLRQAFPIDIESLAPTPYQACQRLVETLPAPERDKLLSLAGVTHVATLAGRDVGSLSRIAEVEVQADRPLTLYRNPGALPRVRLATRLVVHRGIEGFRDELRRQPASSLEGLAFIDTTLVPPGSGIVRAAGAREADDAAPRSATVLAEHQGDLLLEKDGPAGFLVVSDAWNPDLFAEVDGRPAPLLLVDIAFRAVPVPAGKCRVLLRYSPFGLR